MSLPKNTKDLKMIPRFKIEEEKRAEDNHSVFTPLIPSEVYDRLPHLLREACQYFPDRREKDLFLTSALGILSGCLPGYHFMHELKKYYTNLFVFVSAPAASGKSKMNYAREMVEGVVQKLKAENQLKNDAYQTALNDYHALPQDQKQKQPKPEEPAFNYLFIPANSSSAALTELLKNNDGKGIIFESEADTLSSTFEKDWANYSDNLRKSFEHEDILQNRKGLNNYIHIENPRISIILSGTPMQLVNLIKSHENGLFSRFIYYNFRKKPKWKKVFSNTHYRNLADEFKSISKECLLIYEYCESKDLQFQWNNQSLELGIYLDNLFDQWTDQYIQLMGEEISSTIFRFGVTITRIGAILSLLRDWQHAKYDRIIFGSKEILDISIKICEVYLGHAFSVYGDLPEIQRLDHHKSLLYNQLPNEFKREQIQDMLEKFSFSERTLTRYLKEFTEKGLLENFAYANYRKVKKNRFS